MWLASFPGSHAPEREIEVVQAWRAWYFLSREKRQRWTPGRRHLNCAWAYVTQNRKRNEGSGQLTTCIELSGVENHTHRALKRSWLNNAQTLPFCFCPILITSCLRMKDTRLSTRYIFAFRESLGTRLMCGSPRQKSNIILHMSPTLNRSTVL